MRPRILRGLWIGCCLIRLLGRGWAQPPIPGERILLRETPTYLEYSCQFPSPLPSGDKYNDTVWGYFLLPRSQRPVPGAVVLHSLGNTNLGNEMRLARAMAHVGVAVLLITLPYHMERLPPGTRTQRMITSDLSRLQRAFRQAIADTQAALTWLQQQSEIDKKRLAIVGLSLGAVVGGSALGYDERVEAAVLLLGGGNLGAMVWHSLLFRGVRRAIRRQHLSREALNRQWAGIDPAQVAHPEREVALLLVNARYDWVIPRECADALWEAWHRPPRVWVNAGHYGAGLYRRHIIRLVSRFLEWALLEGRKGSPPIPHHPIGHAPKLQTLWLQHGGLRVGVALEIKTFDADGDWAWDVGVTLTQLYTGLTVNVLGTGGSRYVDLGLGYGIDRHGRAGLVLMAGFHF